MWTDFESDMYTAGLLRVATTFLDQFKPESEKGIIPYECKQLKKGFHSLGKWQRRRLYAEYANGDRFDAFYDAIDYRPSYAPDTKKLSELAVSCAQRAFACRMYMFNVCYHNKLL